MALLSRRIHNVGYFRPIIPDVERDNNLHLILEHYSLKLSYEDMYAYKNDDAQKMVSGENKLDRTQLFTDIHR